MRLVWLLNSIVKLWSGDFSAFSELKYGQYNDVVRVFDTRGQIKSFSHLYMGF